MEPALATTAQQAHQDWRDQVRPYTVPNQLRSFGQVLNTIIPLATFWTLVIVSSTLNWGWQYTLGFCVLHALFVTRAYVLFHDLTHASMFTSKKVNELLGGVFGLATFTSYHAWRHEHAMHHATVGHLDRRGNGDIYTYTVSEYLSKGKWMRLGYRIYRNPFFMLIIGPVLIFAIERRVPDHDCTPRVRQSVHCNNVAFFAYCITAAVFMGPQAFLFWQLVMMILGGMIGVWLLYVHHNHEETYWKTTDEWTFEESALQGSSFLKLPRPLRWVTANIGYHHVHHLSARIPNYRLKEVHETFEIFANTPVTTLWTGIKGLNLKLWDEQSQRLVPFSHLRTVRADVAETA